MLESYVTPLLMSYVNRYIKNLKPSDLQLSLWGGDVVLSKLDLKLDVLEQELKLPFTFLSGHIHELRIHVPWTKLSSEPVVITINTMECILKLKDGAQDENESSASSRSVSEKSVPRPRRVQQSPTDPDLPPGYVQSLIRRVINNVNIVVNNLILKYVEDDIVLSVNITSAECYTVDELWDRAFMDIATPELVLRKVINFADCTVCLDKRNASGKIEFYQDPLLYKCSFTTRLHFTYHNINSKIPAVIKIQTMVESLKLSLTDQQLPMFMRVLELAVALYYGEIGAHRDGEKEETVSATEAALSIPGGAGEGVDPATPTPYPSPDQYMQMEDEEQGWVSWAWSFVPALVSTGEDEVEEGLFTAKAEDGPPSPTQLSFREPIVAVGFYCTKAIVTFKLTEGSSESSYYSPQKVKSREVLCVEQEGITVEALMLGETFFDCQIGVVGCRALCLKSIMGVRDFEESMGRMEEDAVFFHCGESLSAKGMTYLTNSLFDYRSPENNGVRAEFILDGNLHKETYSEAAGLQRFGAFYLDYLYTMENASGRVLQDVSAVAKQEPALLVQETSVKRLAIGPLHLQLHSSAVHRILKMAACAMDHEYEPYCKAKPDVVEECRTPPGQDEVAVLEEFIPTRLTSVTLLKASVTVAMAEFNRLHILLPAILGQKGSSAQASALLLQPSRPLPALRLQVERVNLEHSVPMYGPELTRTVSSLSQPSDNLLHHCYTHCYLKVFELQAGLTLLDSERASPLLPIIPSFSAAVYGKMLNLPAYWLKRPSVSVAECMFELPHFTVQATHAQMLLLKCLWQSWTYSTGSGAGPSASEALISEVYRTPGGKSVAPTVEVSVHSVELKVSQRVTVWCSSGTLGAVKVAARTVGGGEGQKEQLVVLLQAPSDTREFYSRQWLGESHRPQSLLTPDLLTFSLQVPQPAGDCRNSSAVLLLSVQGIAVNVDPVLSTWLLHQSQRPSGSRQTQQAAGGVPMVVMKRREDEASVGSTPLAKQLSNQASDYASSPVKTKTITESRPLSIPVKVMRSSAEHMVSSEERMKELMASVWDAVKRLTLQVELQSCCVFVPKHTLPCPSTIACGDIPGTVRSWYHSQASMPGTLVVCLPQVSVLSAGHRHMEPLQEIPFTVPKPVLEEGDAFPWTVTVGQFSVYTLLGHQRSLSLLEPAGCTSTLAVTSHKLQPGPAPGPASPESRHAFIVCLHVDLQPLHLKLSNPQVQLLYELFASWSSIWEHLQRRGILPQAPGFPDPHPPPAGPPSPVHSSAGTVPPDTSTLSPSADLGSPTEADSTPLGEDPAFCEAVTLEQRTSSIGGASGKVSVWMQWMLPRFTLKVFSPDPSTRTEICVISELEDLSASVDVQDVYTKVKCKVGSFNVDHYRNRPGEGWQAGFDGVILQCKDKALTAAKALEVCHQPHGFLSVTYTQAVTRNVRHKLTARQEGGAGPQKLSEGGADGSPQHLHEILLTAQPFDLVLSCPLLANVAQVFHTVPPPPCRRPVRERRSAGQPMRGHAFCSSSLPLIYVNTSVIRVFCPLQEAHCDSDSQLKEKREDTLVLKIGSVSMAPQADNPLTRTVLRKDIYQRALNLGVLRDPGSDVEDRQYQIDLQSINMGTAQWEQLRPEGDGASGATPADGGRSSQNPALEWNMASSIRRHQERRAILTPILTDFSIRITVAPAIIYSKPVSPDNSPAEEIVVCGHSLEVNVTSGLDMFLSVSQVQLLQQLLQANVGPADTSDKATEMHKQSPTCGSVRTAGRTEPLGAGRSPCGQDSGFGSDSACLRIVQIDQQSGTSHHRLARPSRQPTITKNLSFIPFDVFLTAGRLALMTYAVTRAPKSHPEPPEPSGKSAPDTAEEEARDAPPDAPDRPPAPTPGLSALTAEDLLNANSCVRTPATPARAGLLALEGLSSPCRASARQALGITVVRQPGRRGPGGGLLQPLLFLQLAQPSALISCHQRRQRLDLSLFDLTLKGVTSDYICLDSGKSLPESLDYSVFWLQTVAGEADSRTGIPPPLLSLCIRDFLNGPAELKAALCRPLKVNPTLAKVEQAKSFWRKIFPESGHVPRSSPWSPQYSPGKTSPPPHGAKQNGGTAASPSIPARLADGLQSLAPFHKISLQAVEMVVVLEIESHPARPSLTLSASGVKGSLSTKSGQKPLENVREACVLLHCEDVLVRTGLKGRSTVFAGPFSCCADLEARWCRHSGSPASDAGPPRILLDLKGGLLQVFWGQEHYNCIALIQEYLRTCAREVGVAEEEPEEVAFLSQPPPSPGSRSLCSERSSDDLRTGLFQYIQDSASQKLPGAHEVVFYNETEDSPGVMMWRYPEPRVLTFVRITPVPFNTTEDPDISTADLGDVLQVPCSLEFWDELKRAFVPYREFSLSESSVCELTLPPLSPHTLQTDLVASDLWRVVVNSTGEGADESSDSESGSQLPCEQLVSPTALAACTRVDSSFAPWFVPSVGVSLRLAYLELRLCHHLDQLGTVPSQQLRPFLPDRKLPSEQEYGVVCVREPQAFVRQWSDGARLGQELHFSSTVYCHLVDYRNLTLFPLLQPFSLQGHATNTYTQSQQARTQLALNCSVFMEAVQVSVGQHAIHTLDTALQAWKQNLNPAAEEVLFSHYVICNDTQETLRFGQVDTDESVLLASGQSHQYCWRSHKSPQLLHICIEGWGNWRWSEPFSIDNVGALLRSIQRKGQTATLIIKVQQLSGVQKQIIICGRQVMCSYLSEPIEVRLVQRCGGVEGQTETRKLQACVEPHGKLPSYVLEDCEVTELCVRACGDEDWSQDVHLERGDESNSRVLQVPSSSGSLVSVWCTVITLEPNSHMQQRVVVFSPLFVMRNHLPEAVLVQVEKRSLGQKETQLISGQGQHQALLNVEPDITHHLTFQASEEEDASHCAVPISSSLIKQIANKAGQEEKPNHSNILEHFYGPKSSNQQSWPYTCRDTDRAEVESLAQWDSPMQVRLCAWRPGLSTLLVELLPWALLSNRSHWDLWLFEGESIVLQIPAGKTIVPPNFKEALQIGLYWPHTNTVHKSAAVRLLHELTSPRWKEVGGAEVLSLDEEGYVEADIILGAPPRQKLCQFCVSSTVRYGIQVLQIEDKTTMVNNTPHTIHYRALLSEHALAAPDQLYRPPADTSTFTLAPVGEAGGPSSCAVPCWTVLGEGPVAQLDTLLPHKHILLSCLAGPKQEGEMWSQPVAVQPDFPRQSVCVPVHQSAPNTLSTRALVVTYQEHLGIGYISVNEDACPRMLIHNHCPMALLLKENIREPARTEVFCRKLPPLSSVNHELYHHSSSFPDCRQREALPTLMLCAIPDLPKNSATSEWTEAIDINNPGTQVMFLPSFGCLYIEVTHEGGTIILTFAPESSAGTDISQAQRVPGQMLSFRVLLSEVSVALCDDITSPAGSVELLRLTLSKLLVLLPPPRSSAGAAPTSLVQQVQVLCGSLQVDNQLYNRSSFHFPVLLCQEQRASTGCWLGDIDPVMNPEVLEEFQRACFLCVGLTLSSDRYCLEQVSFCLKPARIYLEDTFVYYLKTLFHTYLPISTKPPPREQGRSEGPGQTLPLPVYQSMQALVQPVRLQRLLIEPVSLLVSIHASLKLYIASDHTPLSFSVFERGPVCTTPRQLIHALTMHYAAGALFRAGWVVGSLEILGSPASLVRSIGNGVADLFRLPYEGLTRGPGAFVSGVSRGTSSFVRHISKGTLTSITNLATSLARNMDRLSLDEEHYTRQEEWRRQLPESLGHGLRQGLSRLGISLLGAIAGIVDQPMQTFTRPVEAHYTAGSTAKGIISGVGKGIVGVFTKPIGGAAELVSQTGYGILHGAGLWQLPKQLYLPTEKKSADAPNSQLKYVWKMLQSLGRPEVHMALCVCMVSSSGQEHAGCLLLSGEVLFVVSVCEDTQQQAFPITEVQCRQDTHKPEKLTLTLQQQRVTSDSEGDGTRERLSEQQYSRLVDYVTRVSQYLSPSPSSLLRQPLITAAQPPSSITKAYHYHADPAYARVFICKFNIVKSKALCVGFN
ncbi:vacuolar protein sorting-associated protein 13B isoform X2 [Electrophorus electricus]|uniref:vacuolar protein sorting-associated protein 13B isoform X2 n=1 Tax=Electrophorus electricus TaxID=8005 RepID=UPI0015CFE248|nr:vacuolar protein sorting-associated protein 13B isoform X2 [Electrophorus electricus]